MDIRSDTTIGGALVGLASIQFGVVVVLGASLLHGGLAVTAMLAIRFAIAAVMLASIALARGRSPIPVAGERVKLALLGLAGYSIEASLFFAAIHHGTATAVTLLFFTYPVFVAVVSRALGERAPGRLVVAALCGAVAGAAIVVAVGGRIAIRPVGIALSLGSAVMFTIYLIGADRAMKRTDPLVASGWVSAWASLGLFATFPFIGGTHVPDASLDWLRVVAMGVGTGGAFVCLMAGLRRLGPVRTSIVAAAEPFSSAILATIFLGDPLRWGTAAGGVLILASAVTASLARRDPMSDTEVP